MTERQRRTFSELMIEQSRLIDMSVGQGNVLNAPRHWPEVNEQLAAMFREAMQYLDDALVGWDEANGRIVEAHTKGFLSGMKADTLTRVQTGIECVRVDCGAQTIVGEGIVRCTMINTHPGAHRSELSDGRRFRWEPTSMMSGFDDEGIDRG